MCREGKRCYGGDDGGGCSNNNSNVVFVDDVSGCSNNDIVFVHFVVLNLKY